MNSVTLSGEANVFHPHSAAEENVLIFALHSIYFPMTRKAPFLSDKVSDHIYQQTTLVLLGSSLLLLFHLTFMLALVDGGSAAAPRKTGRAH